MEWGTIGSLGSTEARKIKSTDFAYKSTILDIIFESEKFECRLHYCLNRHSNHIHILHEIACKFIRNIARRQVLDFLSHTSYMMFQFDDFLTFKDKEITLLSVPPELLVICYT